MSISETRLVAAEEVVLCEKGRDLVEQLSSFKCFNNGKNKGNHPTTGAERMFNAIEDMTHSRLIYTFMLC